MKDSRFLLLILLFSIACQSTDPQRIVVPELNAGFYSDALAKLDEKLEANVDNTKLIRQKLYYCERLDWPVTCLTALDYERSKVGMTRQLANNYIKYFIRHNQLDLLGDFIDRWDAQFGLYEENQWTFIQGLVSSRQYSRAQSHLRDLLSKSSDSSSLAFATRQYLAMSDTILATYYLSQLQSIDMGHSLMFRYALILDRLGQVERAFRVFEGFAARNSLGLEKAFVVSFLYSGYGYTKPAIRTLKPYCCLDTVSFFISDLYQQSSLFDSSMMYLDSVLIDDPANLNALWKKGRAYEDRGWFSYATRLFEEILELDTNHIKAEQRIDLIQRKIAYLQRQKQEVIVPPRLELKPIKFDN